MGAAQVIPAGMTEDQVIALANTPGLFAGDPGNWMINQGDAGLVAGGGEGVPALTPDQIDVVQNAVDKSNDAANTTPQAAQGELVTSDKPKDQIKATLGGIFDDLNVIEKIGDDVVALQKGGKASIHPWGWHATLDEPATQGLIDLLKIEIPKVGLIAAAFSAEVPVLAAVGGVLTIAGAGFGALVEDRDSGKNGVDIKGWLWVIPYIKAL